MYKAFVGNKGVFPFFYDYLRNFKRAIYAHEGEYPLIDEGTLLVYQFWKGFEDFKVENLLAKNVALLVIVERKQLEKYKKVLGDFEKLVVFSKETSSKKSFSHVFEKFAKCQDWKEMFYLSKMSFPSFFFYFSSFIEKLVYLSLVGPSNFFERKIFKKVEEIYDIYEKFLEYNPTSVVGP